MVSYGNNHAGAEHTAAFRMGYVCGLFWNEDYDQSSERLLRSRLAGEYTDTEMVEFLEGHQLGRAHRFPRGASK